MQDNTEEKDQSLQDSPHFGVVITSPDGKREMYPADQAALFGVGASEYISGKPFTLYTNDTTKYSLKPQYKASLSYGDNGKVSLKASKSLVDRNPDFLKEMRSNSTLKSAIKAYENNLDAKFVDPNDDSKTISAKEVLDMWNEGLQDYVKSYVYVADAQDRLNKMANGATFSETQARMALSGLNRGEYKNSTSAVVQLPTWATNEKYGWNNYESYDPTTHSINAKDFYTWYNLDKAEEGIDKGKSDMITEIREQIENMVMNPGYFKDENGKENETTKDDFVKSLAFYNTLNADTAEISNAWTGAKYIAMAFGTTVVKDLADTILNVPAFFEGIANGFNDFINGVEAIGNAYIKLKDGTILELTENEKLFGRGTVNQFKGIMDQYMDKKISDWRALTDVVDAGVIAGHLAVEIIKQIVIVNAIGATAGTAAQVTVGTGSLTNGFKVLFGIGSAEQIASLVASVSSGFSKIGFVTNVMAQGAIDALLSDGALMAKAISQGNGLLSGDLLWSVGTNTVYNLVGELSGVATTKFGQFINDTNMGKMLNYYVSKNVASSRAWAHEKFADFADWVHSVEKSTAESSMVAGEKQVTNMHRIFAERLRKIADVKIEGEGAEALDAAVKAQTQAKVDYAILQNVWKSRARGVGQYVLQVDYSVDAKVIQEYKNTLTKTLNSFGIDKISKVAWKEGNVLPKEATDYIYLTYHSERLEMKAAAGKKLTKVESNDLAKIKEKLAKLDTQLSAAQKKAILAHRESLYNFYYELQNLKAKWGIISEEELTRLRAQPEFGEGGRKYLFSVNVVEGENGLTTATKMLENAKNFSAKTGMQTHNLKSIVHDYLDPELSLSAYRADIAKVAQSKEWGRALVDDNAIIKTITNDANLADQKYLAKLKSFKSGWQNDAAKLLEKSAKDLPTNLVEDIAGSAKFKRQAIAGAKQTANLKQKEMAKILDVPQYSKAYASSMTPDELAIIQKDFEVPDFTKRLTKNNFDAFKQGLSRDSKNIIKQYLNGEEFTVSSYNRLIKTNPEMSDKLTRSYIANNKKILNSPAYKQMVANYREASLKGKEATVYKQAKKDFEEAMKTKKFFESISGTQFAENKAAEEFLKDVVGIRDAAKEIVVEAMGHSEGMGQAIKMFTDAGVDEAMAKNFLADDFLFSAKGQKALDRMLDKYFGDAKKFKSLTNEGRKIYKAQTKKALISDVESDLNTLTAQIRAMPGTEGLIDPKEVYARVSKYVDEIGAGLEDPNVVRLLNDDGTYRLVEVDPVTADLYNNVPNFNVAKQGLINKFFNTTNRLFKLGTTGWSIRSFTNQWFRDTMNSYVMAGLTRTISQNTKEFAKLWGDDFVKMLQDQMTKAGWDTFVENAVKISPDLPVEEAVKQAAVEQVTRTMPAAMVEVGGTTSTQYFRNAAQSAMDGMNKEIYGTAKVKMRDGLLNMLEDKSLGNWREVTLRKMNYAQAYRDALSSGMGVSDAGQWAKYVMDNATTDFSRPFAWGNRIANSIPYLGAAINGSASFWRLLELDPLGVSGRFMCGLVLPAMALYAESFSNEENRKIYKNIPEYEKDQAIAFVYNGKAYTLPIPQELAPFFNPIRHAVEMASDMTDNSFPELLFNDVLSIPAVDLSAFVDLDHNKLLGDPTITDRLSKLAESAVSQLSPAIAKTVWMGVTGRDPYTGKNIDTSYQYIDKDGNLQTMDYTDSWLAKSVASWFGDSLSPSSAYALLKNSFGTGLVNVVDSLANLFNGDVASVVNRAAGDVISPVTMYEQEESLREWKAAVRELEKEKEELLNSGTLQTINSALSQETDVKKRSNLLSQYNTAVRAYQNKVIAVANGLKERYSETYDKNKLASVIALLNFSDTATGYLGNQSARDYASETYYSGREAAIATMYQLGFRGDYDYSIFGYLSTDASGNTKEVATTPLAILNAQNISYSQSEIHVANLENLLKQNGVTRSEMFYGKNGYYTNIKNGMTKKQAKAAWNNQVVPVIVNYINKNGWSDSILSNSSVVDMLQDYIFVDNPYKAKDYLKKILKGDNK